MCHLMDRMNNTCQQWCSRGEMQGNAVTPNIFGGMPFPQIISGQGGMVIKVNSSVIKVKCLISYIVICNIGESLIDRLKLNIVTTLLTTST